MDKLQEMQMGGGIFSELSLSGRRRATACALAALVSLAAFLPVAAADSPAAQTGTSGNAVSVPAFPDTAPAKHVVLIGLDGLGWRWIPWDLMPNLAKLRDEGAFAVARCHRPTASAINWRTVFTGLPPELHGFNKWNSTKSAIEPPPSVFGADGRVPCIFSEIRRQSPGTYTACLSSWSVIGAVHNSKDDNLYRHYGEKTVSNVQVWDEGIRQLENAPGFMFLYNGRIDTAGHGHDLKEGEEGGWGGSAYKNNCAAVDADLGRFMDALKASPIYNDTAVIVIADHGGLGKAHGGIEDIRVFEVPFIVGGPAARGLKAREPVLLADVAPTVLSLLGGEIPGSWRGRPAFVKEDGAK